MHGSFNANSGPYSLTSGLPNMTPSIRIGSAVPGRVSIKPPIPSQYASSAGSLSPSSPSVRNSSSGVHPRNARSVSFSGPALQGGSPPHPPAGPRSGGAASPYPRATSPPASPNTLIPPPRPMTANINISRGTTLSLMLPEPIQPPSPVSPLPRSVSSGTPARALTPTPRATSAHATSKVATKGHNGLSGFLSKLSNIFHPTSSSVEKVVKKDRNTPLFP